MYTLITGKKTENLLYHAGTEAWELSELYWYEGKKVRKAYNTETKEIKILDIYGNVLYIESEPTETE